MSGFITKKECRQNQRFIIRNWGLTFYLKCLKSEGTTFLSLLIQEGKI